MKKNFTTIYFVRHGQSAHNIQEAMPNMDKAFWDASESSLTELGVGQAKAIAEELRPIEFSAAFSSNLLRTKQTLSQIIQGRNIPIEYVDSIYERKSGNEYWQLSKLERQQLDERLEELSQEEKFAYKVTPNSESPLEAVHRLQSFLDRVIPLYQGKTILVVNHGGLMRFLLMKIGWAKFDELPAKSITNTGYYILQTDGIQYFVREVHGINRKP